METLPVPACADPALAPDPAGQLLELFFGGHAETTRRAYQTDLEDFRSFAASPSTSAAIADFLRLDAGQANGVAIAYKNALIARGLAANTVNRRLAALRSLVTLAKTVGLIGWMLLIKNTRAQPFRDTKGPGTNGVTRLLAQASAHRRPRKAARDVAIVRLLHDLGLRRSEVLSLDREHYDVEAGTLSVLGKGAGTERIPLSLPAPTKEAVDAWLAVRGDDERPPLFLSLDNASKGTGRLTGQGLYFVVRGLGRRAGLGHVKPHGLRHSAITLALETTGGDVRSVAKFSRHRDVKTVLLYDDNRRDLGGDVAKRVAAAV